MNEDSYKELEQQIDYLQALMKSNERRSLDTLERLRMQNAETRKKLEVQREIVKDLERRNRQLIDKMTNLESGGPRKRDSEVRLAPKIGPDTVRTLNIQQHSEFEVIPFISFVRNKLYQLESGMVNKPETAPIADRKREITQVMDAALDIINKNNEGKKLKYTEYDLAQGYTRNDKTMGTQYELYFETKGERHVYQHIQLFRPFAPIQQVQMQVFDKRNEWINLIVPLSGRVDTFRMFMEMFVDTCVRTDQRVFLTIVYFGEEGKAETKEILEKAASENHFSHYKFIPRSDQFSRGVGLLAGAEDWDRGNTLLFFCDVDITFEASFLDRCRLNTAPGSRVYYPIVFSLYNPDIVYSEEKAIPFWRDQLVLTRNSGFWRTFGFGMTCMYRSDFLFMRGFDTNIQGWGFEDVKLYRKFVQSNLDVVRAPDGGIFHMWHEKHCDPHLPPAQYNMCLGSKAIGEASHVQLGMLAFRELKKENERLHKTDEPEFDNQQFDNMDEV